MTRTARVPQPTVVSEARHPPGNVFYVLHKTPSKKGHQVTRVLLAHPGAELYGSDRMAVATVAALTRTGFEVTVAVPNDGPLLDLFRDAGADVVIIALPVLRKSLLRPLQLLRLVATMPATLIRAIGLIRRSSADLLYVNTITQPWWIAAGRLARIGVIAHVREAESELSNLLKCVLSLPLTFAHAIPCNSRATEEHVHRFGLWTKSKTSLLYNGKDWSRYLEVPPTSTVAAKVVLLLVGRISPRKGTDTAVEATAILRGRGYPVHLTLVGDVFPGYEWFPEQLRADAQRLEIADHVEFAGFSPDPVGAFASANIVIVPSRVEPFGTVAAEGMAAARCTVVARTQGLVEIVDSPVVGSTFEPGDAKGLADACAALIEDPEGATLIASAGRESVVARFSTEGYATETVKLVSDLVRSR
jgi:glycosyltransferase involved in cell wall biosynthesis